jgi:Holliday junction resolvase RusA-like endonuclease
MRFKLKMIPPTATAQQKGERVVKGYIHHYKKNNVAQAEAILRDALLPYVPEEPITDRPIYFGAIWEFPYPKSAKKHEPEKFRQKFTRPDTDNLNKLLKDVMTDMGFWKDDALISVEFIEKVYSDEPGILILITDMKPDVDALAWEEGLNDKGETIY